MGSEMCIRDRALAEPNLERRLKALLLVLDEHSDNGTARTAAFMTCLLYTSDAADERSSVDLGGRRIIKKKQDANLTRS